MSVPDGGPVGKGAGRFQTQCLAPTNGQRLLIARSAERKPRTRVTATHTNGDAKAAIMLNGKNTNSATTALGVDAG